MSGPAAHASSYTSAYRAAGVLTHVLNLALSIPQGKPEENFQYPERDSFSFPILNSNTDTELMTDTLSHRLFNNTLRDPKRNESRIPASIPGKR